MIETVFDVLNAKAAIYAIEGVFDELGVRLPLWISGTITDASRPHPVGPYASRRSGTRCATPSR